MLQRKNIEWGSANNCIRDLAAFGSARKAAIGAENVFDFSMGSPSAPVPEEVTRAMEEVLSRENVHNIAPEAGFWRYREAVAADLKKRFGMKVAPEYLCAITGAAGGLAICAQALLEPGDEAIVFPPFFTEYRVYIEGAGGVVVPVPSDPETLQPDMSALAAAITERTRMVLINTPNNPSGALLSRESLEKIREILLAAGEQWGQPIFLVTDEPYRELVFGQEDAPCPMNVYENTILCYSFSKSLSLPGERIGYLAVHPDARDRDAVFDALLGAAKALGYAGAPSMMQLALEKCMGLTADLSVYEQNRDLLYSGLTELGFSCVKPEGAFYLFVKTPIDDAKAFSDAAKKYELLLVPSDDFGVPGYVRLAYCVPTDTIRRALPAFRKLAEEFGLAAPGK